MNLRLVRLKDDMLINPEAIVSVYFADDGVTTVCMRDGLDIDIRKGSPAHAALDEIIAKAVEQ